MSIGIGLGVIRDSGSALCLNYYNAVMALNPAWYLRFEDPVNNINVVPGGTVANGYGATIDVVGLYPSPCQGRARSFITSSGFWDMIAGFGSNTGSFTFVAASSLVGGTGDLNVVFSISGPIGAAHTIFCGYEADGRPSVRCIGNGYANPTGPTSLAGAGPRHMAWRWNEATFDADVWVNGTKVATANNGGTLNAGTGWREIGAAGGGRLFKGILDEAVHFPVALSDAQITALYNTWIAGG